MQFVVGRDGETDGVLSSQIIHDVFIRFTNAHSYVTVT